MKLQIYDLVVMGNICFQFRLDQIPGLSARIIYFFDMGSFLLLLISLFFLIRLTWLCLDGFEDRGIAAEMLILSRFLLMTSYLLFACLGSF